MFSYKTLFVIVAVLALSWLIQGTAASAFKPYRRTLEERNREEMMELAKRVLRLDQIFDPYNIGNGNFPNKRNGGTADTLYNLPDLEDIGRR